MWSDEDGDDASTDSDNDDSDLGRLYDFVVAKTNDQEENVVARPGFTVHIFLDESLLILTSDLLSEDVHTTPRQSTLTAKCAYRSQRPVSEAAPWRKQARYHEIQACEEVGREDFTKRSERFTDPPPSVSVVWASKRRLDRFAFQWTRRRNVHFRGN